MKKQKDTVLDDESTPEVQENKNASFFTKLRSPLFIIVICALLISGAAFGFSEVKKNDSGKINAINSEYVDINSISDSWNCPFLTSGVTENSNSLILFNPGTKASETSLKLYGVDGKELASRDYKIAAGESKVEAISSFGNSVNASAVIESFGAPVVVYRQLSLSDGREILPCVRNPQDVLELDNLVTKRNTNSTLILSNPHNESVVVDIKARLFNTDQTPFTVQLDDSKGVVIPAYGRTDVDLQATFGRHSMINITVDTRSGFISGEALVEYKDGGDNEGQTIVTSSVSNLMRDETYVFGSSPLNILAQSSTLKTASVDLEALGTGNRVLNAEPQSLAIGSASTLIDPGAEYGFHAVKLKTNIEQGKGNSNLDQDLDSEDSETEIPFISIVSRYLGKDEVGSNTASSLKSKNVILATLDDDYVGILNPTLKNAKVTISFLGTNIPSKTLTLSANSYDGFSLNDLELSGLTLLKIESTQEIAVAASRTDLSGVTSGVYLKK